MAIKKTVQDLLGVKSFTRYGLMTQRGELLFFRIAPTNITVLSPARIESKIMELKTMLMALPDLEIICTDDQECFDSNKLFLEKRNKEDSNPMVREMLEQDLTMLDSLQLEMVSSRQFVLVRRVRGLPEEQVFTTMNATAKAISDQHFEVSIMEKEDIKRFLSVYFGASVTGDALPDMDGLQYLEGGESSVQKKKGTDTGTKRRNRNKRLL